MSVDVGIRLGSLEITAVLGKGGMGEVYRARDTKLKRDVASSTGILGLIRIAWRGFRGEAEILASLARKRTSAIAPLPLSHGEASSATRKYFVHVSVGKSVNRRSATLGLNDN